MDDYSMPFTMPTPVKSPPQFRWLYQRVATIQWIWSVGRNMLGKALNFMTLNGMAAE
jgi:hypothetical protein